MYLICTGHYHYTEMAAVIYTKFKAKVCMPIH